MSKKPMITIRLTPEEAHHVWMNADGWMDAGACEDGLEPAENKALGKLCEQIMAQLYPASPAPKGET